MIIATPPPLVCVPGNNLQLPVLTSYHYRCFAAQAHCYSLIWCGAREASGVHPFGGEGLGAELSQTLQSPHLQQAAHGETLQTSRSLM